MAETIDEAVQEIKDHIDTQKADMLDKMNTKFEIVKNFLHNKIKEGTVIIELPGNRLPGIKKRYNK